MSMTSKWVICRGGQLTDSSVVANVSREVWSMHRVVQARLPGSDTVEYSMRDNGCSKREIDILHRGHIIGHVSSVHFSLLYVRLCQNAHEAQQPCSD